MAAEAADSLDVSRIDSVANGERSERIALEDAENDGHHDNRALSIQITGRRKVLTPGQQALVFVELVLGADGVLPKCFAEASECNFPHCAMGRRNPLLPLQNPC